MGALLLFILKNPSQVYALIMQVIGLIDEGVTWVDIQKHLSNYDSAAKKAEETKDTSGLENLFDPKSTPQPPAAS